MTGRSLVLIPTYNEAANILLVIQAVLGLDEDIAMLVIDDGSSDGTAELVHDMRSKYPDKIDILERESKLGLGTAYLAGFRYALENNFDFVCEMDADFSHNPTDLPQLIAPVKNDTADLAVGSRYINGVRVMNWPLSRLILSYGAGIYTRAITRLPVHDVTAGFKCYHRRVLEAIDLHRVKSNGYSFQIEMKYRAWRKGYRLTEVPIVFTERTEGQSKMSKKIVWEAMHKVWELRFRDLIKKL
ncbi:MAG: polyprenol monophosphomannose synthase [Bacteroidota bacterium]